MSLWKGKGLCPWTQVFKVMENMQRSLEGLPGSVVTAFQVSGRCGGAWTRVWAKLEEGSSWRNEGLFLEKAVLWQSGLRSMWEQTSVPVSDVCPCDDGWSKQSARDKVTQTADSSGGWEVQGQGAGSAGVWWEPSSWFADSCLVVCSCGREDHPSSVSFIKALIIFTRAPPSWSNHLSENQLLKPLL